jgi:hypothetical protein
MRKQVFAVWEPVSKNGREDAGHEGCNRDELKKQQGRKPLLHGLKRLSGYFSSHHSTVSFQKNQNSSQVVICRR